MPFQSYPLFWGRVNLGRDGLRVDVARFCSSNGGQMSQTWNACFKMHDPLIKLFLLGIPQMSSIEITRKAECLLQTRVGTPRTKQIQREPFDTFLSK
eukprot:scaffold6793_cov35-Attheya_sp.AAC.1